MNEGKVSQARRRLSRHHADNTQELPRAYMC